MSTVLDVASGMADATFGKAALHRIFALQGLSAPCYLRTGDTLSETGVENAPQAVDADARPA